MKKILLIILFAPLISFGQTYFGLKAYSGLSMLNESRPKLSLSGGLFLQEDICKHLSLRQEALFTRDGYSEKRFIEAEVNSSGDTTFYVPGFKKVQYQVHSIELPVSAIYKIGNKIKPYIGAGASLKFVVLSRTRINITPGEEFFRPMPSNGMDVSVIGFLGVEAKIKETPVHFEARYNNGFLTVFNNRKISSLYLMFGFKI